MAKTRTGKKILSLLLTLCMALNLMSMIGITASAGNDGKTVVTTPLDFTTMGNTDKLATEGWAWYATASEPYAANTLVLDGATIDCSGGSDAFAVSLPDGSTIDLTGTNAVKTGAISKVGASASNRGIFCNGALTIGGTGTLRTAAGSATSDTNSAMSFGIQCTSFTLNGSAIVEALGGSATTPSDNTALSCGIGHIYSAPSVTVNSGTLTATGGSVSSEDAEYAVSCGIFGTLTATGGNITVSGNTKAIFTMSGTALTAEGATITAGADANGTDDNYTDQKWLNVSFDPSISVGAQSAKPVYGTAEDITYTVTATNFGDSYPAFVPGVSWTAEPAGVSCAFDGNTLTTQTTEATPAGSYTFKVTSPKADSGNYESALVTFIVNENLDTVGYSIKDGKLTGTTTNMEYTLNGSDWVDCTATNTTVTFTAGDVVKVRDKNDTTSEKSIVTIPAAPTVPTSAALEAANVAYSVKDGTFSGLGTTYEWSNDGGMNWFTTASNITFTDSTITVRTKATDESLPSVAATLGTIAAAATAPTAPTIGTDADKPTAASITISTVAGKEYYISTSATAPTDWSGMTFVAAQAENGTHAFTALTAQTQYYIHVRTAATDSALASASANTNQYTAYTTPTTEAYSIESGNTVTFDAAIYEISTSSVFAAGTAVANNANLDANTTYYIRHKADTINGIPASAVLSFTCAQAVVSAVTLIGTTDGAVSGTATVTLTGDTFVDLLPEGAWDTNVAGVTATASRTDATHVSITFSGTPTVPSDDALTVTIPAAALASGAQITTTENVSAKWSVTGNSQERTTATDFTDSTISYKDVYGNTQSGALTANITDSGEGWAWYTDGTTVDDMPYTGKVLVLSGCNITAPTGVNTPVLKLPANTTLVVKHGTENSVVNSVSSAGSEDDINIIYGSESLTIAGDGSLHVTYDSSLEAYTYAIYAEDDLTITDAQITVGDLGEYVIDSAIEAGSGSLNITDSTVTSYARGIALTANTALTITDSTVNGSVSSDYSNLWSEDSITVDGSTVNTWGGYDGLGAYGNITIQDGSTVTCLPLAGYESNTELGIAIEDDGSGTITLTDSTVTATAGSSASSSVYGIFNYDGDIAVTNSTVNATAGNATGDNKYSIGIYLVDGDMTVTNSTVNATAGSTAGNSLGIAVDSGTMTATNSTINGTAGASSASDSSMGSFGISSQAGSIVVNGGNVTGTAGTASANSVGVFAGDTINMTAGTLTGNSAQSGLSAGIAAGGSITYASSLGIVSPSGGVKLQLNGMEFIASSANAQGPAGSASIGTPARTSSGGVSLPVPKVPVVVDGKKFNIGTTKTFGGVTTVIVDQTVFQKQLDAAKETVAVPVTPGRNADTVVAQFVVANVDEMAEKEMTLSVQVDDVSYNMRAVAIDTETVMKELGATDPTKAPVSIAITELSNTDVTLENGELVMPPVSFTVTASYGSKTVEVEMFEKYVQRVIEIPSGVDSSKITTAVVVENGKQRHVPTDVYEDGGKWYAKINSLTNSTYALIFNEASFTDDDGKWFETVANEMASRGIINGRETGIFDGDANITRAEFATILVHALGLPESGDASEFNDVAKSAWCFGAIGTAYEYGIVNGRTANTFAPDANITRQEAMAMVHRAAAITEFAGTTGTLSAFSDADSIGAWALEDAQWNVGSGLIQGNSAGEICGQDNITRGETAAVILRLLQKSELVDMRTKA